MENYRISKKIPVSWFPILLALLPLFQHCQNLPDSSVTLTALFTKLDSLPEDSPAKMHGLDSGFSEIKNPTSEDRVKYYQLKSVYYGRQRNPDLQFACYDTIIRLAKNHPDNDAMAEVYVNALIGKGDIRMFQKRYDETLTYWTEAKILIEQQATDNCRLSKLWPRIGDLLYQQEYYLAAAAYYSKAAVEDTCFPTPFLKFAEKQCNLDNAGMAYRKAFMPDSAAFFFDSTLRYITLKEGGFPHRQDYIQKATALVLGNQAILLYDKGNYTYAERLFRRAIPVLGSYDVGFTRRLQLRLADLYLRQSHLQKAKQTLDSIKNTFQKMPDVKAHLSYLSALSILYGKLGDKKLEANYHSAYLREGNALSQYTQRKRRPEVLLDLEARFQKNINETLKKDKIADRNIMYLELALSLLITLVFITIFLNYRKSARLQREIALTAERERISKDLHDDLGGNLTSLKIMAQQLRARNRNADLSQGLNDIAQISEAAVDQMDEAIWMLNNVPGTLSDLMAHIRYYIVDYLQRTDRMLLIDFQANNLQEIQLTSQQRRNIIFIIKELFHNTIKHSAATDFIVHFGSDARNILLSVGDNGPGLDSIEAYAGNGLRNIKQRTADLGGEISVHSETGLQIHMKIPKPKSQL